MNTYRWLPGPVDGDGWMFDYVELADPVRECEDWEGDGEMYE